MDVNLEFIKMVKKDFEIHILIELPYTQLHANIFNLNINLDEYDSITSFWTVADKWNLAYLADYFEGSSSVNFVIYKSKKKLQGLYATTNAVIRFINNIQFDYLHFDDFSARQLFILPFIGLRNRLILNIHDAAPHKGEFEWKRFLIKKMFYKYALYYLTFSQYSKNELNKLFPSKNKILVFHLLPYSVFKKFQSVDDEILEKDRYVSFIGRFSPYKGIDLLLGAIVEIIKEFPDQKFLIAGRSTFGFSPDFEQIKNVRSKVVIIERHLTNEEIANTISASKLVVCPYREATQSGVIMTSYALDCPVLVTNTGGLAEYVSNNVTGLIAEQISKESITDKLREFLSNHLYETMHDNIKKGIYISDLAKRNSELIKTIYN